MSLANGGHMTYMLQQWQSQFATSIATE